MSRPYFHIDVRVRLRLMKMRDNFDKYGNGFEIFFDEYLNLVWEKMEENF